MLVVVAFLLAQAVAVVELGLQLQAEVQMVELEDS
jgi:hypothetical protein